MSNTYTLFFVYYILVEHRYSSSNSLSVADPLAKPHQPTNYKFPKRKIGQWHRSFQPKRFNDFPWLHYNEQNDSVICFTCSEQEKQGKLANAKNKERAFIYCKEGFSNWKEAIQRFQEHTKSDCHVIATEYHIGGIASSGNVMEMYNVGAKKTMEENRRCFLKIIESLRFLSRQGLAMQGSTDDESNFYQLIKIRAIDVPLLHDKYTINTLPTTYKMNWFQSWQTWSQDN